MKLPNSGVRTIKVVPAGGGAPMLYVEIVVEGETLLRLPGELVAPLRYMFTRIEEENPGLCGTDEAARRAEVERMTLPHKASDPRLN